MNKLIARFALLAVLLVLAVAGALSTGKQFTLLHVNDTHSHLDAGGPKTADLEGTMGGIAKAATVIGQLRASEQNVILLHAGDVFQGDPLFNTYFGVPEFQLMQQMGFDAMAVGNHEFDFGPGVLNDVLTAGFAGGSFPLISANLDMSAFPSLRTWVQPAIMKTVDGVQIGIFGLTVPDNPTNMPAPVVVLEDVAGIAQATADSLRHSGAQVVILLSHLGIYFDRIVAANTTGIDFIVGGHDHFVFQQPVMVANPQGKNVPVFQAGEHYNYVGRLRFEVDGGSVTMKDYALVPVDNSVTPDPAIRQVVETLKEGVIQKFGDIYHTALATAPTDLAKRYDPQLPLRDTPMGNLVTDAFRNKTGTDLGITALGLISEKIYAGPIVGADVFRALSYGYDEATGLGFKLATFDITGAGLLKGMEIGLSQLDVSDDFFLQYSGLRFRYDPSRPVGSRVIPGSITMEGRSFSPLGTYSVTVNTGIVYLLGSLGITVQNLRELPDFEYNVVRDFVSALGTVSYHSQGRVREQQGKGPVQAGLTRSGGSGNAPAIAGNYPNPFNPSTVIRYMLPQRGYVTLKVYNSLGQEVRTLVAGVQEEGENSVQWDAGAQPSGVYFCRLQSGVSSQMIRMLLVK